MSLNMKSKIFIRSNPHLPVRNLRQTLDYYRDTLGFHDQWKWADKNGDIKDGGIRRNDM
jgi:catechol 2,3-dioxygenase-like lactoylglutathione lyase family enzyme